LRSSDRSSSTLIIRFALAATMFQENSKDVLNRIMVCALVCIGVVLGVCAERGLTLVTLSLTALCSVLLALSSYFDGMCLGRPYLLPRQTLYEAFISSAVLGPPGLAWAITEHIDASTSYRALTSAVFVIISVSVLGSFGSRGACIVGGISVLFGGYSHLVIEPVSEVQKHVPYSHSIMGIAMIMVMFLSYRKEQNTVALMAAICAFSMASGELSAHSTTRTRGLFYLFLAFVLAYLLQLWRRRHRKLPPGLQGCKFVKLSYFRKLAGSGGQILRCQELPPEAFGDFAKAQYLIVISHRWLDRHACDQDGLRLRTLVDNLDEFFSTRGMGQGTGPRERWRRFVMSLSSGNDVIVFFDFMALPQIGFDSAGNLKPRTEEETQAFRRILPHMGTLYSTFPVMICDEVPEGVAKYEDSGWCFCELCIASLGKQLKTYNLRNLILKAISSRRLSGTGSTNSFLAYVAEQIESKNFHFQGDRNTVQSIIDRFSYKSILAEAIAAQNDTELSNLLASLKSRGLQDLLNQPIDAALNTPLHLAVKQGFKAGVMQLMHSGAALGPRNLCGDTAVQCYMWPRLRSAAFACRRVGRRGTSPQGEDTCEQHLGPHVTVGHDDEDVKSI